jgi:cytochrome c-type biogenesis protein CcmH
MRIVLALVLLAACEKPAPAPPPNAREAQKGLPPLAGGAAPQPAAGALPPGRPALPPGHPDIGRAAPAAADGASLEGTIDASPALKDQVKAGDTIFLVARSVDPSGAVTRMPLAVARLSVGPLPMPFKLTAADVMMQGSAFAGTVQITARVDRDGEAMSRNPGDIEGVLKAEIPARGLKIVLDTPVKP